MYAVPESLLNLRTAKEAPNAPALPNVTVVGCTEASHPDFDISDEQTCETLFESQEKHFWFVSRNATILSMLRRIGLYPPARFLEVGCGTGTVLSSLREAGYQADGVEMHHQLSVLAAHRCRRAHIYCLDVLRDDLSVLKGGYRAVGLFDVLEHVADPAGFLSKVRSLVGRGGLVVGTVPALSVLWSAMDEAAGHRRRYTRDRLCRELEAADLKPVLVSYFFHALAPAIWMHRKRDRARPITTREDRRMLVRRCLATPSKPINTALRAVCLVERLLGRCVNLSRIPGASVFFAAGRS